MVERSTRETRPGRALIRARVRCHPSQVFVVVPADGRALDQHEVGATRHQDCKNEINKRNHQDYI